MIEVMRTIFIHISVLRATYLAALGNGVGFLVLVRTHAKVFDCFTGIPLPSEKHRVGSGRRAQGKLVQSNGLSTSPEDTLFRCLSEAKSRHGQLWDFNKANVIGDSSNGDDDLGGEVWSGRRLLYDSRERNWGTIDFGEEETVEDCL